jgi:signal transduction histidine kinase
VTDAALAITASDLHRRVPLDGSRDEVGRLAEAFNEMIGRLEAAFEETRRFTTDAAHELRTPLAVLRTSAEVALRNDGSDFRRVVEGQLDEISRLSRLADQLLFLCREEAGLQDHRRRTVRLDLLLEELCERLEPLADERGCTLHCEAAEPCVVFGAPDRLQRLFLNLLDNALRYTTDGGRVDLRCAQSAEETAVTIADDGAGISADDLPRVFDRFYRGDASRSRATGGSGLGLSICRRIARSLGGDVTLESTLGRGTTARVRLPRRPADPG